MDSFTISTGTTLTLRQERRNEVVNVRTSLVGFALWLICSALRAQNISCSLSGTLQDPAGAVIPGQEVVLEDTRTGFVRTTKTTGAGFFSFPDLAPSRYNLKIVARGFKEHQLSGIDIASGENRTLGVIRLEVGGVNESISVVADSNPVMLASGEKAAVMTGEEMKELTLRGRDFFEAVGLLAGVVDVNTDRDAPASNSIDSISILGGRFTQKNMTIDGVANIDTGSNVYIHTMPSMDAIGEVKVLMSNYSAEHGRNSGGVITVVTRGGGREFHGSASWFRRHESLNANNFFNNRNGLPRTRYRYNIVSYTLGGPIYVPGRFNKDRNRLFFFFSQEFQRQLADYGSKTVRVPTEPERQGDFSQSFDVNGKLYPVRDPLTNAPFPNYRVPANRFSRSGQGVLNLFPKPNFVDPEPSRRYQWNYISALSGDYPRRTETLRIDYSPRPNVQLYTRMNQTADQQHSMYGRMVNGSVNFPLSPILWDQPGKAIMLHSSVTLSPSSFNELILGISQRHSDYSLEFPEQLSRQKLGIDIPQWRPALNPYGTIPSMSFSGVPNYANPSLHNAIPAIIFNPIVSAAENFSRVMGTHALKTGFYFERARTDRSAPVNTRGDIAYDRNSANPLDAGYAYTNALLGVYSSYTEASARPRGKYLFNNIEWYFQDNWKATRRLSLDYGVRFYRNMPVYDDRDQIASFVPAAYDPTKAVALLRPAYNAAKVKIALDPVTGVEYPQAFIGTYAPGRGDPANGMVVAGKGGYPRSIYTTRGLAVAPRFGFAWDPLGHGRTAVRGGAGVFFDRTIANPTQNLVSNPPMVFQPSVYYGYVDALTQTAGAAVLAPSSVTGLFGHKPLPVTYNYSFGIQQQIGKQALVDISYVGSLARHLPYRRNYNAVPAGARFVDQHPENRDPTTTSSALPPNFLRPYQGYGDIYIYHFDATSNYHGLLVSLNRRLSRGIQAAASYTFSKVLGIAANESSTVSPFWPARQWNYGPLSFDRSHVFSARWSWELPALRLGVLKPLETACKNWQLLGILRMQTGAPFTPGMSTVDSQDITGTPSESARPLVIDPSAPPQTRFGRPPRGSFGNAGVGILRLPGINNWDLSLSRRIPLGERNRSLQLRLETYNTFNHPQFSALSTSARFDTQGQQIDPLFLQPTAARNPRILQLSAVLRW